MVNLVEQISGKSLTREQRERVIHGADEIDLVNSGLEETMYNAYDDIRELWLRNKLEDLRTASFVSAIDKIAISYMQSGIFP
jgi:glutamate dehydrogenase (NAD(P)+)